MPIRINLLAETQAAEEQRRKDPVKRTLMGAIGVVALVSLWCVWLQVKLIATKAELHGIGSRWKAIESDHVAAVQNQKQLIETENKLEALEQLRTNRFLWGSVLNAFQQSLVNVDGIQVIRFQSEQTYKFEEEVKPAGDSQVPVAAKPASSTEKILFSVEAKDTTPEPGSKQITAFKEAILRVPYFQERLQPKDGIRLTNLSAPQSDKDNGVSYVNFTMQCNFPEQVR